MNPENSQQLEQAAWEYLRAELGGRAPQELRLEGAYAVSGLDGEGATALFSFDLLPGGDADGMGCHAADPRHYIAVGDTQPNYFPAYGLDANQAFSFHLGTRFMLELEMRLVEADREPAGARELLRGVVAQYGGDQPIEREELAVLFECDEGLFAVYRLTIGGQDVYCMGADCPPGFYAMTEHPPQVALRLHLGGLIRAEANRDSRSAQC